MDLVAESLTTELAANPAIEASLLRPAFRHLIGARTGASSRATFNAERAVNRYALYPFWLRSERRHFDLFHVIDHSYAHLVNCLPAARTIVTCYDLDAFRCLLEPAREPRSAAFRALIRHVMRGFRRAARVVCASNATRDALLRAGLRSAADTEVIHIGLDDAMLAESGESARLRVDTMLGARTPEAIEILHVGSVERRKRIDLVIRIFAGIAKRFPAARLLRVGGALTAEYAALARELGVADRITTLPFLDRDVLAALYRRVQLVILPSDGEGFGMPALEALAAGTPVLASDIAVLREVGGDAARYRAVGEIDSWVRAAEAILRNPDTSDAAKWRYRGIERARQFSWRENASRTARIYESVAAGARQSARATAAPTNSYAASNAHGAAAIDSIEAWNPPDEGR
jgi:glycosyltransferase involved in cell wall biosynthesis